MSKLVKSLILNGSYGTAARLEQSRYNKADFPKRKTSRKYPCVHAMADKRDHARCLSSKATHGTSYIRFPHGSEPIDASDRDRCERTGVLLTPRPIVGTWKAAPPSGCRFDPSKHQRALNKARALKIT